MSLRLIPAVLVIVGLGCSSSDSEYDLGEEGKSPGGQPGSSLPGSFGEGLPCDVDTFLQAHCRNCHQPGGTAEPVLMTWDDLQAPGLDGASVGERAAARIVDAAAPMPPSGVLADDVAGPFLAWVAGGMPQGECAPGTEGPGGVPVELTCVSGTYWTQGDKESENMYPGRHCLDCHGPGGEADDKFFPAAGTVFPGIHDTDDCFGLGGVTVELVGANGATATATTKESGNFFFEGNVSFPATARVRRGGNVLEMTQLVENGDCNACHTAEGSNGAEGRIIAP